MHGNPITFRLKPFPALPTMKLIALLFIFFILASLGSALYYLLKDQGQSDRVVKALTVRVALSMVLFLSLMASYYFGWIPQTGLR
jgi:hypothetical protein